MLEQRVKLGIDGFQYRDLYDNQRLADLTIAFDRYVERNDGALFGRFDGYRFAMQSGIAHGGLSEPEESALLIETSRHLAARMTMQPAAHELGQTLLQGGLGLLVALHRRTAQQLDARDISGCVPTTIGLNFPQALLCQL